MNIFNELPSELISHVIGYLDPYNKVQMFNSCIDQLNYHRKEFDYLRLKHKTSKLYGAPDKLFVRYIIYKNRTKNITDFCIHLSTYSWARPFPPLYQYTASAPFFIHRNLISRRSTLNFPDLFWPEQN